MEYNIRNRFLEKSYTKWDGEAIPRPLSKIQNWAYLWISSLKCYTVSFYCMPSWGLSKDIETKPQTTSFYLIKSFFKKQKEVWNKSPCLIFCINFVEKYFSCYIFFWVPLLREILSNMCIFKGLSLKKIK